LAKNGHAPTGASTLSAVRVLYSIAAYPFLAKKGYGANGAYPILAKKGYATNDAYPNLAKKGHAPTGASTPSAVRVLYPIAVYPILAKKGYGPDEA